MEQFRAFLRRKNIVFSAKRYRGGCLGGHGPGALLYAAGRDHSQYPGNAVSHWIPVGHGGDRGDRRGGHSLYHWGGWPRPWWDRLWRWPSARPCRRRRWCFFSLVPVGYATNILGGAGGPLAVLVIAIVAAECGKAVSKETKVDILVTPIVTVLVGIRVAYLVAPPIGTAASWVGNLIMWATGCSPSSWEFWSR